MKHLADTVTHALEQLVEESRAHNLSKGELENQFDSSHDLNQWEQDYEADIKRRDKRARELQETGVPHAELVAILEQEARENTSLQRTWFQHRIIRFAEQIKMRLSGYESWYVDSKKKWRTHDEYFVGFPRRYFEYRSLWNNVRELQKELPRSLKREDAKEQIIQRHKELKGVKDLVECLFERQRGRYKWSPSELAIVHAARHSGYWEAKTGQARWLFDVLKAHPKYAEARNLYGGSVEE